jgi:outer membrane protein assembly factor BamB
MAVVLFCAVVAARAVDWPQYRGITQDGTSAETGWLKTWPPTEVWRANIGIGFSSLAVSEGRVYATGSVEHKDYTYCFDALTGAKIWSHSFPVAGNPTDGPRATPTVDGDRVYTLSHMGDLYCFNKVTGEVVWNKKITTGRMNEWGFAGSPLVDGNMLILNAGGNQGMALDKNMPSKVIWSSGGTAGFSSPKIFACQARRIVIMQTTNHPKGGGVGIDAATGEWLWGYGGAGGTIQDQDPQFYGTDKFFTKCGLYQISPDGKSLTTIWKNDNLGWSYSLPVIVGDYVYGITSNSRLRCVSLADGSVKWSREHMPEGTMIASDGKIIWFGDDGLLIIFKADPKGYDTEGREPYKAVVKLSGGHQMACPVLANGLLYCRSYGGDLVCLSMGAGKAARSEKGK